MPQAVTVQFGVFTVYIVPMNAMEQQSILHLKPWTVQLWTNQSAVCILAGARHFLFSKMSWLAVGPTKPPIQWVWEVLSLGLRLTTRPLYGFVVCAATTLCLPLLLTLCNFQSTSTLSYKPYWNGQLNRNSVSKSNNQKILIPKDYMIFNP
jgi:hypothetical protein